MDDKNGGSLACLGIGKISWVLNLTNFCVPRTESQGISNSRSSRRESWLLGKGRGGIVTLPVFSNSLLCGMAKVRWFTYETCWFSIAMLNYQREISQSFSYHSPLRNENIAIEFIQFHWNMGTFLGGTRRGVCHHQNPLPRGQWEVTPSITTGSVYESNESQARYSPNKSHPSKYSTPPF